MAVGVDKPGRYRVSARINDLGLWAFEIQHIIITTDSEYVLAAHRQGGRRRDPRVHRYDVGVFDNQVGRSGCILSRCR